MVGSWVTPVGERAAPKGTWCTRACNKFETEPVHNSPRDSLHTKSREPVREHAAVNESLKLPLDEQRGAPLVIMALKLPEEGL